MAALEARDAVTLSYAQQTLIREEQRLKGESKAGESAAKGGSTGLALLGKQTEKGRKHHQKKYVSCVEKMVISALEISRCPNTKPSLELLSLRDLTFILSVIQMREHFEHLHSHVILRDGLLTLERQAI